MSSKRVSVSEGVANEDTTNKRRRINNDDDDPRNYTTVSFSGDINDDCKVLILSFLQAEEMNSFAICSQDCRRVRRNESLDQTRTATLCLSEETTPQSFSNKIRENQHVLTGNRSRLKVVGLDRTPLEFWWDHHSSCETLPEVTSLDCSFAMPTYVISYADSNLYRVLSQVLPSLRKLDLSNLQLRRSDDSNDFFVRRGIIFSFQRHCPALTHIVWKGMKMMNQSGLEFSRFRSLSRLHIDKAVFSREASIIVENHNVRAIRRTNDPLNDIPNFYLFMSFTSAQHLSIKGATLMVSETETAPLPQDMLLTMARRHPSLKWLKSDLTPENIQLLQKERPDITFVS